MPMISRDEAQYFNSVSPDLTEILLVIAHASAFQFTSRYSETS